ncbi:MAG: ATP-binding protein [Elusimicrobiota bacterium]
MKKIIDRKQDIEKIRKYIGLFPITAILGPRQAGKTFISKQIKADYYFDLENPRDLEKLGQPQLALGDLEGLIVIDEIQRLPNLFPLIRYLVDTNKKQKYLILGSASKELVNKSSESLAGRIGYYYLDGLSIRDIGASNIKKLWLRGGFPRAYLADSDEAAALWLENYITTYLERDIPQLGIRIPANTLRRFWIMLSHYHGQIINYSEIGRSFGISDMTVRHYIDILKDTYMIRVLFPWYENVGKRLVKRPKIYLRDSGVFHAINTIKAPDQLYTYNKLGASWEGFALENCIKTIKKSDEDVFFWNTHGGAELDLFWQDKGKRWGIECKYQDAPKITKSMHSAFNDLKLEHLWVVYPGEETYKLDKNITVISIKHLEAISNL